MANKVMVLVLMVVMPEVIVLIQIRLAVVVEIVRNKVIFETVMLAVMVRMSCGKVIAINVSKPGTLWLCRLRFVVFGRVKISAIKVSASCARARV